MLTPVNTHSITQTLERTPAGPALAVCGAVCGCFVLNWADPTTPGGPTPLCPTKALFGIDCPGCGTARALYSLTHLDVSAAVRYNILAVVAVILVGWSWCVWLGRTLGKRVPDWSQWRYASWTTAVVVFVWFIVRLLPWEPCGLLSGCCHGNRSQACGCNQGHYEAVALEFNL